MDEGFKSPGDEASIPITGRDRQQRIDAESLLADPEQTLCFCRGVPASEVRDAILATASPSIAELQRHCPAGTGCGSCHPEIQALIRELLKCEPNE
ncbi:(2Fe-2S)-binding protein [bacterium]|nr:(2Fe-2S)-binding protein [bacterium]